MAITNLSETGIRVIVAGADVFDKQADRVEKAINDIGSAASKANKGFGGFNVSLSKIGSALTSLGTSLTKNVTLPLLAANTALTAFGIEFEDAFAGATKTLDGLSVGFDDVAVSMYGTSEGLTQAQKDAVFANDAFGQLTKQGEEFERWIRDTALEIPIAATELARITQLAGQLGVQIGPDGATDDIEKFTEAIALVTVATDYTADQAATDFAQLANVVGVPLEDIADFTTKAANAVVALGNNFAATEPDILALSLRFAGFASAVGVLPEEILAISAAVLSSGIKVEAGGTAIARIFEEMTFSVNDFTLAGEKSQATSQQIEKDLGRLEQLLATGMSWDEVTRAMEGSSLEMSGMSSVAKGLYGELVTVDDIITTVRNNTEAKLTKALKNGSITAEEYQTRIKNMGTDLNTLRGVINNGERDISSFNNRFAATDLVFTGLSTDLKALDKDFTSVSDVINIVREQSLTEMNKELSEGSSQLKTFADATGLSEQALAELIKQDPDVAFFKIVEGLNRLNDEGKLSSETLQDLGLDSSRLKQLLFGLGQNQDLYTRALQLTNDEWEDQVALQEEAEKRFKTTKSLITLVKNAFQELGIILFDLQKNNIEASLNRVRELIFWFKDLDESTQRLIVTLGGLAAAAGPVLIALGTIIKQLGVSITTLKGVGTVVANQLIPALLALAGPLLIIGALVGGVYLAFKNNFANIQGILADFKQALGFAGILGPIQDFIDAIKSGDFAGAAEALQEAIQNTFDAINSPTFRNTIKGILETFVGNIGDEIENAFVNIEQQLPTLPTKITKALYPILTEVFGIKLGKEIIKQLRFGINYAVELLEAVIQPIGPGINSVFKNLQRGDYSRALTALKKIFIRIFDNLTKTDFVKELSSKLEEVFTKTFDDVKSTLKNPESSGLAKSIASIISTAFTEGVKLLGIKDEAQKVGDKIGKILEDISPFLPLIIDPLVQGFSDLVEGIIGFVNQIKDIDLTALGYLAGALLVLGSQVVGRALSVIGYLLPIIGDNIELFVSDSLLIVENDIYSVISKFAEVLEFLGGVLEKLPIPKFAQAATGIADTNEALSDEQVDERRAGIYAKLFEVFAGLFIVSKLTPYITKLWSILSSVFGLIGKGISLITSLISGLGSLLSTVIGAVGGLVQFLGIVAIVVGAVIALKDNIFGVRDSFQEFFDKLQSGQFEGAIGSFLEAIGRLLVGIPTALAQIIFDLVGWNADVADRLNSLANQVKTIINALVRRAIDNFNGLWDQAKIIWEGIKTFISGKAAELATDISEQVTNIVNFFGELPDRIKNTIAAGAATLVRVGKDLATPIVEGFKQAIKGLIVALNNAIPDKIDLGSIDIPSWLGGGSFSVKLDLPDNPFPVPAFKWGGRMTGPGIVGESGPELFLPDTSGFVVSNKMLNTLIDLLSPLAMGGGNTTSTTSTFAPTVYGVPMQNEQSMNQSILDLYWATQT